MNIFHRMKPRLWKVTLSIIVALLFIQYWYRLSFDTRRSEPLFVINSSNSTAPKQNVNHSNMTVGNSTVPNSFVIEPSPYVNDSNSSHNITGNVTITSVTEVNLKNIEEKPLCPPIPPNLQGPIDVKTEAPTIEEIEKALPEIEPGGMFRPKECKARYLVALVIPYRDRFDQLRIFLNNIHRLLMKQQIDYAIFVVEQADDNPFNRGKLMNVGFVEALKVKQFDCFIFHDVDLLPEDDRNLYTCPEQPRHMSVAVDKFKYKLPYKDIFGGVSALSREHFQLMNGFSNLFWGWGGEDDDLSSRVRRAGLHISRYPPTIARYQMLRHNKEKPNPKRFEILHSGKKRYNSDGLNSLNYERKDIQFKSLYTWVLVDLRPPS